MTGGRAFLYDPDGVAGAALDARSVRASNLAEAAAERADARAIVTELEMLVRDHAAAGSTMAARLLAAWQETVAATWLVEPVEGPAQAVAGPEPGVAVTPDRAGRPIHVAAPGRAEGGHATPAPAGGVER
jgi:glutamate synthase domain-containing protein 3